MTTQLEWQLTRLRTTRDAQHRKWGALGYLLALKGLKLIPDQGEDTIARGDKVISQWWGRLNPRRGWNVHSLAMATFTPMNTSGRRDGTRGGQGTQRR